MPRFFGNTHTVESAALALDCCLRPDGARLAAASAPWGHSNASKAAIYSKWADRLATLRRNEPTRRSVAGDGDVAPISPCSTSHRDPAARGLPHLPLAV